MTPRPLIFRSHFSLGDIVLMTAAVRDLHRCYPGRFITDVRTPFGELWDGNPWLRHLDENRPEVQTVDLGYPLINFSNQVPCHALHGFADGVNEKLGLEIKTTEFKGDLHLSDAERSAPSAVAQISGQDIPYWLVAAGGKFDVTIKWWETERYQQVVDHFRGRIQFVQVGAAGDWHPKLDGTIDLRGQTSVRELLQLVHHSQGVLCGVTALMHLAAAVEGKTRPALHRPCVVVAGGREPTHWEAYPNHQFIHTIGALSCCATGGCWRSRTVPLGDGDARDRPENLCVTPAGSLPRCMDMITAAEVIRRIETYFQGGALAYLNRPQAKLAAKAAGATLFRSLAATSLTPQTARPALERVVRSLLGYPGGFRGRGLVIAAGGVRYFTNAWVCLRMLRRLGCTLPVQFWHLGPGELDAKMKALVAPFGVECVDALALRAHKPARILRGWELKPYALLHSKFREIILLDADNVPAVNPEFLFDTPEFQRTGALFWPDQPNAALASKAWALCGLEARTERPFESGQIVLDKKRGWKPLCLTMWFNEHSDFWYEHTLGDKETFHLAWRKLAAPFAMPKRSPGGRMRQYDFQGRLLFQHRNTDKWSPLLTNRQIPGFRFEQECRAYLEELRAAWDMKIAGATGEDAAPRPAPFEVRAKAPASANGETAHEAGPVTVVTLHDDGMASVGRLTSAAWQAYARARNYGFIGHDRLLDPARHPAWNKILAVRQAVAAQREGWVMWVDADAMVMNHRVRVEDLLPPDRDLVFASDFNGLCSGVFLVRCSEWTLQFLDAIFFLGDLNHDPDGFGPKWEQNTIKLVLKNFAGCAERVTLLPQRQLNSSIDLFQQGDFILHLGVMSNGDRVRVFRAAEKWVVT